MCVVDRVRLQDNLAIQILITLSQILYHCTRFELGGQNNIINTPQSL